MSVRFPSAVFALLVMSVAGCALTEPQMIEPRVEADTVVRGQAPEYPSAAYQAPGYTDGWRPAAGMPVYVAPGESDCTTGPDVFAAPTMVAPLMAPPSYMPQPTPPSAVDAGWLDFLPPEGGPIASDFGVPVEPTVRDRVPNPIYVRTPGGEPTWEALADVVVDFFPIRSERRVRQVAGIIEEGQIETKWQSAETVLEPWKRDTVGAFNRWQSTLQTLRRRALVRVIPAAGGYEIGVRVDKQLEDLPRPELATAGAASLRNDASLPTDRLNPVDRVLASDRWINIGRDEPLEQKMLREIAARLNVAR